MNPSTLRRLRQEYLSLHRSPLPPNYLFPSAPNSSSSSDLTTINLYLRGPPSTPFSAGLFSLILRFPPTYPTSPPTATFNTRIFHPNVDPSTGAVCVDTLKRDWKPELTVRDIMVTISCLLVYPNPDSALNSEAGTMLQEEDWEGFGRRARMMTEIHAKVPESMRVSVEEARKNDGDVVRAEEAVLTRSVDERITSGPPSVAMKKMAQINAAQRVEDRSHSYFPTPSEIAAQDENEESEGEGEKENDPSLSPSPVSPQPPSPRKNILGKRPLSSLPTPIDPDADFSDDEQDTDSLSPSERNIAANQAASGPFGPDKASTTVGQRRKSPKLTKRGVGINTSGRIRDDPDESTITPYSDPTDTAADATASMDSSSLNKTIPVVGTEGKENITAIASDVAKPLSSMKQKPIIAGSLAMKHPSGGSREPSTASTTSKSGKPRVGLRRL